MDNRQSTKRPAGIWIERNEYKDHSECPFLAIRLQASISVLYEWRTDTVYRIVFTSNDRQRDEKRTLG